MAASDHLDVRRRGWRTAPIVAVACALAVGLGSCAPEPIHEDIAAATPGGPADFPADDYRRAAAAGHRVLRIDPGQSLIAVDVRRDGILARRAEAGFSPQPDAAAIAGTRRNMLTRVLDAGRFPFARIAVRRDPADAATLQLAITLHGVTQPFVLPAQIEAQPDGLAVTGALSFRQSDFGIVPMSALNGALRVADRLDLRFRIVARPG